MLKFMVLILLVSSSVAWEGRRPSRYEYDYYPEFSSGRRLSSDVGTRHLEYEVPAYRFPSLEFPVTQPEKTFKTFERRFFILEPKFDYSFDAPRIQFDQPKLEVEYDVRQPKAKFHFDGTENFELREPNINVNIKKTKIDPDKQDVKINYNRRVVPFNPENLKLNIRKPVFTFGDLPRIRIPQIISQEEPKYQVNVEGLRDGELAKVETGRPGIRFQFRTPKFNSESEKQDQVRYIPKKSDAKAEEPKKETKKTDQPQFKVNLGEPEYDFEEPKVKLIYSEGLEPKLEFVKPQIQVRYKEAKIEHIQRPLEFTLRDLGYSGFRRRE